MTERSEGGFYNLRNLEILVINGVTDIGFAVICVICRWTQLNFKYTLSTLNDFIYLIVYLIDFQF